MKKIVLYILTFIISFLFFNFKSYYTEEYMNLNYYEDKNNYEEYTLVFDNINIKELYKIISNSNIEIMSIEPSFNKYNIDKLSLKELNEYISLYCNVLDRLNYDEESLYIKTNGFNIKKAEVISTNKDLIYLEKYIKFKIIKKELLM